MAIGQGSYSNVRLYTSGFRLFCLLFANDFGQCKQLNGLSDMFGAGEEERMGREGFIDESSGYGVLGTARHPQKATLGLVFFFSFCCSCCSACLGSEDISCFYHSLAHQDRLINSLSYK